MYHQYNTQLNKSINMRIVEPGLMHKNLLRPASLNCCISHVIRTHNLGYLTFFVKFALCRLFYFNALT